MGDEVKLKTFRECLEVEEHVWTRHVQAFRDRALKRLREALQEDERGRAEHWRLMAHVVELHPLDWDRFGLLDRWEGTFEGETEDCSSGCVYYSKLSGDRGMDWGVCTNPRSHRRGKLTFEHQGCFAFEPDPDEL